MSRIRDGRRRLASQPGRADSLHSRAGQGLARLRTVVQAAVGDRGGGGDGDFFCGVIGEVRSVGGGWLTGLVLVWSGLV